MIRNEDKTVKLYNYSLCPRKRPSSRENIFKQACRIKCDRTEEEHGTWGGSRGRTGIPEAVISKFRAVGEFN